MEASWKDQGICQQGRGCSRALRAAERPPTGTPVYSPKRESLEGLRERSGKAIDVSMKSEGALGSPKVALGRPWKPRGRSRWPLRKPWKGFRKVLGRPGRPPGRLRTRPGGLPAGSREASDASRRTTDASERPPKGTLGRPIRPEARKLRGFSALPSVSPRRESCHTHEVL